MYAHAYIVYGVRARIFYGTTPFGRGINGTYRGIIDARVKSRPTYVRAQGDRVVTRLSAPTISVWPVDGFLFSVFVFFSPTAVSVRRKSLFRAKSELRYTVI